MANRYFHGREREDVKLWIKQVKAEMEQLQITNDEDQAMYACQGLADEAWYFYKLLSEEVQCSWPMLKTTFLVKYFSLPKQTDKETLMLIEEFQSLQALFCTTLQVRSASLNEEDYSSDEGEERYNYDADSSDVENLEDSGSINVEESLCPGTSGGHTLTRVLTVGNECKDVSNEGHHGFSKEQHEDLHGHTGQGRREEVKMECYAGIHMQFGGYESCEDVDANEEGLEGLQDLSEDVATSGIAESVCLDIQDNNLSSNVDAIMNASPNVCLEWIDVLDGLNGLLDSEESDSFGESIREGSAATERPGVPCECVQVAMPLKKDSQVLVSKESFEVTSHGSLEIDEGDVQCMHLDVTIDCDQHEELQDNNSLEEIDLKLDVPFWMMHWVTSW